MAGGDYPVIRIMPNTPVAVGQGVVLYHASENVSQAQVEGFLQLMGKAGGLYPLEESLMDVGAAVSGCGPAYAYLVLDAMADGGVACGLARGDAVKFAAQTLLGAAQMVLETGKHPDQLKNEVCSPGGSTIQGGAHPGAAGRPGRRHGRGDRRLREERRPGEVTRTGKEKNAPPITSRGVFSVPWWWGGFPANGERSIFGRWPRPGTRTGRR